ncbi:RagB/SusD family nutrient uptake outer membrane protein [Antarcticibacterium arcticum]|uniref:RagB/SusD family nutrient uptake outer membrane protein n=1 Tax=Antarcticibacterium arcticum TaxID=2585771 RepID=A0A5B8YKX6_9FLAO|nr:RagB/SusD family nutrient uptake outer membrane protein [Antarcticibacterium arcticum]QED37283.1 RagB/SusD family nutrient uptake outer membrane protein [Antarcticibacterium arcticum]
MKIKFIKSSILIGAVLSFTACTNLELEETDSIFREDAGGGFSGVSDVPSALVGSYDQIRGQLDTQENLYALQEVTSDEMLVPTRGTDWGDNGLWRTLHQHTWDPNHQFILNTWNAYNRNVFNLSEIIAPESNANAQQLAEAKFLRAFSMFWVMDLFGQVPFREVDEGASVDPRVLTRSEAFDFVMKDLTEALPDLPASGPGPAANFASKASAHYLLAKILLNKHIYLGNATAEAADMTAVVGHVDAIKGFGFGLQSGFFEIFKPAVDSETIWYTNTGVGSRMWNGLHYFQTVPDNTGGGWNGFTTLAEFYELFEGSPEHNHPDAGQEERRGFVPYEGSAPSTTGYFAGGKDDNADGFVDGSDIGIGFLFGQQYNLDGSMKEDRGGNPLYYTKELPGLLGNNERTGIRVLKYHPSNGAYTGHMILFRYADAHLMKAEAIMRGGTGGQTALALVNELRTLRDATPLGSLTDHDMLDERGRELYIEMWRRQDLIRFGKFTEAWEFKEAKDESRNLFPIPSVALTSNPNLVQNEGY